MWKWSCSVVSDSLQPHGLGPTRLLYPWDFPGNSTGVDCHFLLQGIFPTQGLNPGLLHCRQTLYHLSHQGSPGKSKLYTILKSDEFYREKKFKFKYSKQTDLVFSCVQFPKKKKKKWRKLIEKVTLESLLQEKDYF